MVALPTAISPTVAAIDAYWAGRQDTQHYPFIRGSQIGKCERHLWYLFRWAHAPELFEGRILRLFETGHRDESRMIRDLQNAGVAVRTMEGTTPGQIMVTACDGHFRGHLDGEVEGVIEAPATVHLLECKTHSAKNFAQLLKHGVAVAKPEHVAQMQVYMGLRSLSRAFYLAKNKDTDELYAERVHFDAAHFSALMAKAERVKATDVPPAKIAEHSDFYTCRFCPSQSVCHLGQWALRTCRTCLHVEPISDGNWFCHRHKTALLRDQQARGCPHHLYLPSLVPGEQVDADEATETVTYRLSGGADWRIRFARSTSSTPPRAASRSRNG